jgi:16S rRNA (cytosine967-C5)-methyltransferase
MLRAVSQVVRPGGRLVYATCSSELEENDGVVDAFLAEGAFETAAAPVVPPAVRPLLDDTGRLRTLPFRDGLEAFFAAVMVKRR